MMQRRNPFDDATEMIIERARAGEPDRYLAALLAPKSVQRELLCLTAFLADLAAIPASVSEPMIGEMRLQWWRDALAGAGSGLRTGNPIADAFLDVVVRRGLPVGDLGRIVDARSHDLTGELHADDDALARYFLDCEGRPFALAAVILGRPMWPEALMTSAGMAYGLARATGRLPALLHNGGVPISLVALDGAGLDPKVMGVRPLPSEAHHAVRSVVGHYEGMAMEALREVQGALRLLGAQDRLAGLPLAMVEPYFAAQKDSSYKHLEEMARVVPLRRIWQLARSHFLRLG